MTDDKELDDLISNL